MATPTSGTLTAGFFVPGVFAATLSQLMKQNASQTKVVEDIMYIQSLLSITCPNCDYRMTSAVWDDEAIRRLHRFAQDAPSYETLFNHVVREYSGTIVSCPDCGFQGSLSEKG